DPEEMQPGTARPGTARPGTDPSWTPLAYAIVNDNIEAARLLIERGANLTVRDSGNRSPEDLAVAAGHPELAELLRARSASHSAGGALDESLERRVAKFLRNACLDWRQGGMDRVMR